jgi:hypothetical protein
VSLLIVEGPDGAGKTTLISYLRKQTNRWPWTNVIHHGAYVGETSGTIARHYLRSCYSALLRPDRLTIMDRSWLAEPVYGAACRGGENRVLPFQRRALERVALGAGAVVVLVLPSFEACRKVWAGRLEREYLKKVDQLAEVYNGYSHAVDGWQSTLPVFLFDREIDDPGEFASHLQEAFVGSDHDDRFLGAPHFRAPWLLIGDRAIEHNRLPFVSLGRGGCSAWLADQLEAAGISERKLAWTNQHELDDAWLRHANWYRGVIALGRRAKEWCETHGVDATYVVHPQHWKRFHHDTPYPLINILKGKL